MIIPTQRGHLWVGPMMKAKTGKLGSRLRKCVLLPRPPFLFLIFLAWHSGEVIILFCTTPYITTCLVPMRAFLCPTPSACTLDGTAGELNRAHTSCSRSPAIGLPSPPSTSFATRHLFIRKHSNPPLPVSGSSLTNSLLMTTPPTLRRKIPLHPWEELPKLAPELPPHPETNGMKQVNTIDALLLSLVSSEVIIYRRSYDILNVEEVEESMKVRAPLQFLVLIHPHTILSLHVRSSKKLSTETKSATPHRTSPG